MSVRTKLSILLTSAEHAICSGDDCYKCFVGRAIDDLLATLPNQQESAEEFADEILQWVFRSVKFEKRYQRPSVNAEQFNKLVTKIKHYSKGLPR